MVEPYAFTTYLLCHLRNSLRPVIPDNAWILRMTAAAGTELADPYSYATVKIFTYKSSLRPEGLHPARGVAPSGFRPLWKIPYCCLPYESGPCLSPSLADHPLRPATDHRLGELLPHQQANQTQALPKPPKLFSEEVMRY